MVNAEGGDIYLGIEDNGTPTGLHPRHATPEMLAAMIGNRTLPAVGARVEMLHASDGTAVIHINVPMVQDVEMTSNGKLLRRRLGGDGIPCTVPMHPYEIASRSSRFGRFDFSAQACPDATMADLDPTERLRLRQSIERQHGDRTLLDFSDEELDGALGLVTRVEGVKVPTNTGMLLLGRQERLPNLVPTHEVLFQELHGGAVRVNDGLRLPLIALVERVTLLFDARYAEEEMMSGMYRVPLPNYDRAAFREGLVNALAHRDYTVNNTIYIRFTDDGLSISNPGGFVEGVSKANILIAEPRSRNRVLADALKRIGLAERTGRGVDNIVRAALRAGRPMPSYLESNEAGIKLFFPFHAADTAFVKMCIDLRTRSGSEPTLEMLIVLRTLCDQSEASVAELSLLTQRPATEAVATLQEAGLVKMKGEQVRLLGAVGEEEQPGGDIDQSTVLQSILDFLKTHEKITRKDITALLRINDDQAKRLLSRLVDAGELQRIGQGKSTSYTLHP